jgi:hypothetical protein
MRRGRIALGVAGVLLALFGIFRLATEVPVSDLVVLALWLIAAVAIHDGVLSPVVVAVGALLTRVPARGRRYLQAAFVTGAMVTVIALPMIYRRDSQPPQKAILLRDYAGNLAILLGIIAALTLVLYAVRVARRERTTTDRADQADQTTLSPGAPH